MIKSHRRKGDASSSSQNGASSKNYDTLKKVLRCQAPEWWWKNPHHGMCLMALQVSIDITRGNPRLWGDPDDSESAFCALSELAETSKMLIRQLDTATPQATPASTGRKDLKLWEEWIKRTIREKNNSNEKDMSLPRAIVCIRDLIFRAVSEVVMKPELSMIGSHDFYRQTLKPFAFDTVEQFELPQHHYQNAKAQRSHHTNKAARKREQYGSIVPAAKLWKELSSYPTALPVEYGSSIFVRALENQMDKLRVLIIGPEDTPYANGCFLFDVHMGNDYPNQPPKVKFLTTSDFLAKYRKNVRFNPNLYADGKVCLSLLGTWAGPGWKPGESTLLQVLVSIQSLILGTAEPVSRFHLIGKTYRSLLAVSQPLHRFLQWYNEPGRDPNSKSTHMRRECEKYNRQKRTETLQVAILPFLKHHLLQFPEQKASTREEGQNALQFSRSTSAEGTQSRLHYGEFHGVIQEHFRLKKQAIRKQLREWHREDPSLLGLQEDFAQTWKKIEETSQLKVATAATRKRKRGAHLQGPTSASHNTSDEVIFLDGTSEDSTAPTPRASVPSDVIELLDAEDCVGSSETKAKPKNAEAQASRRQAADEPSTPSNIVDLTL